MGEWKKKEYMGESSGKGSLVCAGGGLVRAGVEGKDGWGREERMAG